MFTKQFEIFKLFGFSVKIDLSWLIIAILITWSLAKGLFPNRYEGLATATYWWMGLAGMLGLFVSIVLHELGHSLVARHYEMPMRGITLFIFGGVAEMSAEPPSAKAEFAVAVGGPIVTVFIAIICFGLTGAGTGMAWPAPVLGVLEYLALINTIVLLFNLIPAFPLDGGRVLRSLLWHLKGNLKWATAVTTSIGAGFGLFLILFGIYEILVHRLILSGLWSCLLGMFLRGAANMSYQQLLFRRAFEGEPVSRFMTTEVQSVSPEATIEELVEDYVYKYHFKMFPVAEDGRLSGCVTMPQIKEIPREEWSGRRVKDVLSPCNESNSIGPNADAMEALSRMNRDRTSRLMVVEDGRLCGIISLKDMLDFMSLKVELEEPKR